ncbi:PREDICTED: male accessory gland serine protease inhibitor-like [Drosophila arizonae]|uniref:Male accessory gland serine protease inhibitor-like n=1 Tax=Drosophila arizonae TaxID=7263 RepID=A0ABM1NQV2_DROAR|nr:PREDICTED: male accessory gland serine protease inhibitor-like [Drosophila arizonae]
MKILMSFVVLVVSISSCFALKNELCGLPHSADGAGGISCEAYFPSWSYDAAAKECVRFIYGGCGGNDNRFDTKELCEEKCLE